METYLTIKHLAPYLPYGLRVIVIKDYSTGDGFWVMAGNEMDIDLNNIMFQSKHYKPILRPLSDLIKEIEINGEKFVPNNKLNDMYGQSLITHDYLHLVLPIICEPYILVRQLFEWHFDVFGLIKQGLAVDINIQSK